MLLKKKEMLLNDYAVLCRNADRLEPEMFDKYEVQRGLRDKNGAYQCVQNSGISDGERRENALRRQTLV